MNNLNTVLIEGKMATEMSVATIKGTPTGVLNVRNEREYYENGKLRKDGDVFSAYIYGNLIEPCRNILRKGSAVRLVGRLKQFSYTVGGELAHKTVIVAEHIEFVPKAV